MENEALTEELNRLNMSEPPAATVAAFPPWIDLPLDVTANILRRLDVFDRLERAQLVCTKWWKVYQDPALWRSIKFHHAGVDREGSESIKIFRRAVDRSQGQLIELDFFSDGDDDLLHFIANRSPHLRSLRLDFVRDSVSGDALVEAAKKLPNLEEFDITSLYGSLRPQDIEAIANSCLLLKSFAFTDHSQSANSNANAIAKHMPNLRHLRLLESEMDNAGLEAILDGCPRLDSLDLHWCSNLDLKGALLERCRTQIKHFVFDEGLFASLFLPVSGEMESEIITETLNVEDSPPWAELPLDLTANILQRLKVVDRLGCAQLVCTAWWKACQNPAMWRVVNVMNFYRCHDHCNVMCRRAVDLSQGQLISLTIGFFVDGELLDYIADRSPQLRCLAFPFNVDNVPLDAVDRAFAKLPNLEEVHFLAAKLIYPEDTDSVRIFWPLNSFKLDVCRAHSVGSPKSSLYMIQIELVYTDSDDSGLEVECAPYPPLDHIYLLRIWIDDLGGELGKKRRSQGSFFKFDTLDAFNEMLTYGN